MAKKATSNTKAVKSKLKQLVKTVSKTFSKKAAPMKKSATKSAAAKAPLKSAAKKDVKTPAPKKGGMMTKAVAATKAVSGKAKSAKGVELKVKAGAAAPASPPLVKLTKTPKVAKAAKKSAPRNYEDMCRESACESSSSTAGYCRLHYIKNWKKIKRKELILREKKLNQYIEELVSKYPDKYIEAIKSDLADEASFSKVIYDLELDESVDDIPADDEADEAIIDNIKREFDDGDTDF